MKTLKSTIFLSILLGVFFIIYQQSDKKGLSRLKTSLKTAVVIAAIVVRLNTNPVEAIGHDVLNNSTESTQKLDSFDDPNSVLTSPGSEQPSNLPTGTTGRNRIPPSKPFVRGGYLSPSDEQCESEGDGHIKIIYRIKENPALVREAEKLGEDPKVQKEVNNLIEQLSLGNKNPGMGTKSIKGLKKHILEARGRNGGRVYYQKINGNIEILAKSNKNNQNTVIKILQNMGY